MFNEPKKKNWKNNKNNTFKTRNHKNNIHYVYS